MDTLAQIDRYIASQPAPKRADMLALDEFIRHTIPAGKRWYLDGKNEDGKTVSNPNIGYGSYLIHYANGSTREFFQVGLSANTSGISVYIMGIPDKQYLPMTYGEKIGRASVTGYCIKFRKLANIQLDVLKSAILDGLEATCQP